MIRPHPCSSSKCPAEGRDPVHGICCLVNVQVTHASTKLMTALIGVRREERTCAQDLRIKAKQYFIPSAYEASQHNLDSAAAVRTPRVPLPESRRLPSSDCPGEMLGGWNGAKGGDSVEHWRKAYPSTSRVCTHSRRFLQPRGAPALLSSCFM